MGYFILLLFTMCNYARHAKNGNKANTAGVDLYSRSMSGNTFCIVRLVLSHLHGSFQFKLHL